MRTLEKLSSVIEALIKAFQNMRNFLTRDRIFVAPDDIKPCGFRLQPMTFPTEIEANQPCHAIGSRKLANRAHLVTDFEKSIK